MRFAEFDVDEAAGELRRAGARVKLQDLPFRMLVALLRRAGSVVTREELRAELWGAATFVDAEAGLNTAVAKLREALGDTAEAPRFIETIPKRGYRFIGTLADAAPAAASPPVSKRWVVPVALLAIAVAAGSIAYAWFFSPRVTIAVVRFHNETGSADFDRLAGSLTDAVVVSLAGNRRYGVIGNSPLLTTDRIFQDVQKIGGALGVEYVVLGQLQSGDKGLVARAHFIRVSDQQHLWAGKIDLSGTQEAERAVTDAVGAGLTKALGR